MKVDRPNPYFSHIQLRYVFALVVWCMLIAASLMWNVYREKQEILSNATASARAIINRDISFRKWVASHGGVYVVPSVRTPPNPYLKVPDRDVVTTTGKQLTLMNPAYTLREIQENFGKEYGVLSHITSLNPLNPNNAADAWEAGVLARFEQGCKEALEVQQMDGQPYLRLMLPFVVAPDCLTCHAHQGYKVGDIRGGISMSVSLKAYFENELKHINSMIVSHGVIWLIGLLFGVVTYRLERRLYNERKQAVERLQLTQFVSDHAPESILWIDEQSRICYANEAVCREHGYTKEELLAMSVLDLDPNFPAGAWPAHWQKLKHKGVITFESSHRRKDGSLFHIESSSNYVKFGDKEFNIGYSRDVTGRKQAERRQALEEMSLTAFLALGRFVGKDQNIILDFVLEESLRITESQYAFIGLVSEDETVMEVHAWSRDVMSACAVEQKPIHYPVAGAGMWAEPIRTREPLIHNNYALSHPAKQGTPAGHVEIKRYLGVPVFEGERIVAVATLLNKAQDYDQTDVSFLREFVVGAWSLIKRNHAEELLHLHSEILKNVAEGVSMVRSSDGVIVFTNPYFDGMFGYESGELFGKHVSIVNAPGEKNPDEAAATIKADIARAGIWSGDVQNVRKDGSLFWCHASVSASDHHQFGKVWILVYKDITQRKQLEKSILESESKLRLLLESAAEAIFGIDTNGYCTFCNPSCLRMLGYRHAGELLGKKIHDLIHYRRADGTAIPETECRIYRSLLTREGSHADDEVFWRAGGTCFPVEYWSYLQIIDGKLVGAVVTFLDITARRKSEETIWKQANYDTLTGLPNRYLFHNRLELELKKTQRTNLPFALMLIDLDHFKEVNDTLGHDTGDVLLVEAARRINECVRSTDTVARLGGDEFVVILPELDDTSSVERIARSVVQKISAPFQLKGDALCVSASIGIAWYPNDADTLECLLKNADQAMYAAKSLGRNRHHFFTSAM